MSDNESLESINDEEFSDDGYSEHEENESVIIDINTPLMRRKSFPFCFWLFDTKENYDAIKNITIDNIKKIFDIENVEIYIISTNDEIKNETEKLRIICPNIFVNIKIMKDIRSLILNDLGYSLYSEKIPVLMYETLSKPMIFFTKIYDTSLLKWEMSKTLICLINSNVKSEVIESLLEKWGTTSNAITPFSEKYKEYINLPDVEENTNILDKERNTISNIDQIVSDDEIKEDAKENINKSIKWFLQFHKDSKFNKITIMANGVYFLDFKKSKINCKLCKLNHQSNRQYVIYSNKSKVAYYKCYDSTASEKQICISFKKNKVGSTYTPI